MASNRILILAQSGAGKSTSIRTLNPKETFIINVNNKPLPFKGWKKMYTLWSKDNPDGNMFVSKDTGKIIACMKYVNEKRPEIKNLILDDLFYVMSHENFSKISEKGFDKFVSMGKNFADIAVLPETFRDDLFVFYMNHPEVDTDVNGNRVIKTKTIGKLVDNQLMFEGLFDKVLYCRPRKTKDGMEFGFETKTDGITPTKTPMEMFDEDFIPNDLQYVREKIEEYEN